MSKWECDREWESCDTKAADVGSPLWKMGNFLRSDNDMQIMYKAQQHSLPTDILNILTTTDTKIGQIKITFSKRRESKE